MSKVSRVAEVLHMTEPEAREFCLQVQKCFKNGVPSFSVIASAIVGGQGTIRSPDMIAKIIKDSGWSGWRSNSWDESSSMRETSGMRKESGLRSVHFDRSRVAIDELEKCPHGVPKLQIYAICNPKEFHDMVGVD
jgi:hypothetical protein